jgi:zinc protease
MSQKNNKITGYDFVKESAGIEEYTLRKNNLRVLVLEDHSAPVATFMVTYHVGSRNEAIGYTGSTHLLEHLMFKGSRNFNKDKNTAIWTELQNVGAQINATTWNDRTNYFEVVPREHLDRAIAIEADRMRHAFLRDEDRQPEMTVVRNEFERGENSPFDVLDKNIWATAYQAHPYHHSTIGWRSDIENVSTERLKAFYDTYYWPNNATVTVIGDFKKEEALASINKQFSEHSKSSEPIPPVYTEEPEQEGPRRIIVKRAGQTGIVGIAHKTPKGLHKDTYALQVIGKILADGKTSRLNKLIIDKGFSTSIFMYDFPFLDNGLFIAYAFLTPGTDHKKIEEIILKEYNNILKNGVREEEIKRAQAQIRATVAFSRDGTYAVASALNEAIAIGDWTFYTKFMDNINKVTAEKIKEVIKKYFIEDQSTTGWFVAKEPKD